MADASPNWIQSVVAMGGFGALTSFLTWLTTHRKSTAEARKTDAETAEIEGKRGVELERILNEKTVNIINALERQVAHLSAVVEVQNSRIADMERTIQALRDDLHEAQTGSPRKAAEITPFNVI